MSQYFKYKQVSCSSPSSERRRDSTRNVATIWLRGFLVIFFLIGFGFFVLNSLLGIEIQWSRVFNVDPKASESC